MDETLQDHMRAMADDVDEQTDLRFQPIFPSTLRKWADALDAAEVRIAELEAERDEARRRRDEWRKKAEGYDEVRQALREKVGTPWPPHLSRVLWAGIAADEKKRADDAEAREKRLRDDALVEAYNALFAIPAVSQKQEAAIQMCQSAIADLRTRTALRDTEGEG